MKKFNVTSFLIVVIIGAVTAFLWLPLLPMIIPLVTLVLGLRWVMTYLLSDTSLGKRAPEFKHIYFSTKQAPPDQAQTTAWSSLADLPSPAGAGSLPSSLDGREHGKKLDKSFRRKIRDNRHVMQAMKGFEIRKQAPET